MRRHIALMLVTGTLAPTVGVLALTRFAPPDQAAPPDFVPVETAHLNRAPDELLPYRTEAALPNLEFNRPVGFTHAGDGTGRVFVVEQGGLVYVFPNRSDVRADERKVFLDLSGKVSTDDNEEDLLGLAFHPKFRANGEVFLFYTAKADKNKPTDKPAVVVSRFKRLGHDPDRADPESGQELLRIEKVYRTHNAGSLAFGPKDDHLYIAIGDGGYSSTGDGGGRGVANAQNLRSLLGKILRIDVNGKGDNKPYAIPKDNPFVGNPDAAPEVYAYGLRNPWRMSFDPETGDCFVGDIGQDDYEEVNRITRGGNYGWNWREGPQVFRRDGSPPPNLIDPVYAYKHDQGRSITGGVVYRGKELPDLVGDYVYADYISGALVALQRDPKNGQWKPHPLPAVLHAVSAFGYDADGEVYLTAFDGKIHRLRAAPKDWEADLAGRGLPHQLSQTGLFDDLKALKPVRGAIPYDVNVPLWSDYTVKERFVVLPDRGQVKFSEKGQWVFPMGTVFVKTFLLDFTRDDPRTRRRLETRLLIHHKWGWRGYTYLWNDEQTEAELLKGPGSETVQYNVQNTAGEPPVSQQYHFPSRSQCMTCHTPDAGFVLGLNTRQMNREHVYGNVRANQIAAWNRMGVFSDKAPDPANLDLKQATFRRNCEKRPEKPLFSTIGGFT